MIAALSTGSDCSDSLMNRRTVSASGTVIRLDSTVGRVTRGATDRSMSPHFTACPRAALKTAWFALTVAGDIPSASQRR
jgi:hypothetical protein